MLVKCIAVPRERTPKKVEVILSRIVPAQKNTVKLNVRVAQPADVIEEILSPDILESVDVDDNLSGIIPVEELYSDDANIDDVGEFTDIFCLFQEDTNDVDELTDIFLAETEETEETEEAEIEEDPAVSISEINADFEELENDLRYQLGDSEIPDEEPVADIEDEIVQRHFVRDDTGELYASDSEEADGHEVACYDNTGKLKRACGVIRKNQPTAPDTDDIYSRAVLDMFPDSEI